MEARISIQQLAGWFFGLVFTLIGLINLFWGNDPFYGVFVVLLALIYFPPVTYFIQGMTGFRIPVWSKVLLGAFIIWSSLGVGELFDKIELMQQSFSANELNEGGYSIYFLV
ncbi:hypothetical protein L0U88_18940 [Flavihumibacter sp. RY-1]|uniref:Uncharacterized protein n=1 Tax=Flavihumibacter fluminis TaxID=2909236 RepID=A0ABS9BQ34_9BACT|nr:hypothetical protein [Flavihumibacter fluminis]MCF1716726.1 hypothetical protein [Flavihumibacter fluminis]